MADRSELVKELSKNPEVLENRKDLFISMLDEGVSIHNETSYEGLR